MTFLVSGLAIAGAAAMLIPILIHLLLRRRRQPVPWAAMRFLLEAIKRQKRRLQLEQLLLLAARCLILLIAGLALARPVLEQAIAGAGTGSRFVVLVIDNSLASTVRDDQGASAFENSVATAKKIIEDLGPGDAVSVVTAGLPARSLIDPPSTNLSAVASAIEAIKPALTPADIPAAISLADGMLGRRESQYHAAAVYLLSDFRAGSANLDQPLRSMTNADDKSVALLASPPAATQITNVQVVSVEPVRSVVLAGEAISDTVTVRLKRTGGELGESVSRVRLLASGTPLAEPRVVEWSAGQSEAEAQFVVALPKQSDQHINLTAAIDQDALSADDARYTMVETRRQLRIAMLARRDFGFDRSIDQLTASQWINRALSPREDNQLQVAEVDPTALDPRDLRGADIAFLPRPDLLQEQGWPMLRQFVNDGGMLVISPPEDEQVHPWTEAISTVLGMTWRVGVERVDLDEPESLAAEQPNSLVLRLISGELDALAPAVLVSKRLDIDFDPARGEQILITESGKAFVIAGSPSDQPAGGEGNSAAPSRTSRGMVVLFASAPQLDWTTLPAKPLMVPLIQELVRQGVSVIRSQREMIVGAPGSPWLPASASTLISPSGISTPVQSESAATIRVSEPGITRVLDATGQEVSSFAANVATSAGRTEIQGASAISTWLATSGPWSLMAEEDPASALRSASTGMHLAGILLALVLALVIIETLIARWFSHAVISSHGIESTGVQPAVVGTSGRIGSRTSGGGRDVE